MSTSLVEIEVPFAQDVTISDDSLHVDLSDGRTISVPLVWFPRLIHAGLHERTRWRLIGRGEGIHWESVDEDISVEGLLAGRRSVERPESLRSWLQDRESSASNQSA